MPTTDHNTVRLDRLRDQHDMYERLGRHENAFDVRARAKKFCATHALDLPAWAAPRTRGGDGPRPTRKVEPVPTPAPTLGATVAEHHAQPLEVPRYGSLRAWAKAAPGATSRVVCWHPQPDGAMRVSLVVVETEELRKRSITFASEADALAELAAGTVKWQAPRKPKPNLTAGGRKRQPSAFSLGRA